MTEIDEIKKLIRETEEELALGANPYWFGTRLNIYRGMLKYAEDLVAKSQNPEGMRTDG